MGARTCHHTPGLRAQGYEAPALCSGCSVVLNLVSKCKGGWRGLLGKKGRIEVSFQKGETSCYSLLLSFYDVKKDSGKVAGRDRYIFPK